jgi:cytochrome oxidase Cu insertion factor (SCO1/SenC/PrrC family)
VAAICLSLGVLGGLVAAELRTAPAPAAVRFIPPRAQAFDFKLQDQKGRTMSIERARGKVVVLTFLYVTCWDLCPAQAHEIADAIEQAGKGVTVYIVSVDPVGDRTERVRQWLIARGLAEHDVHFLMGSRKQLRPVWAAYGIVPIGATPKEAAAAAVATDKFRASSGGVEYGYERPERPAPREAHEAYPDAGDLAYRGHTRHLAGLDYEHSAYVMLIDRRGEQRVGIPFEQLDPGHLAEDIRLLRDEP